MNEATHLWSAVLSHGLHDAACGRDVGWLGSPDFKAVCVMAGHDPAAVRDRFDPEQFLTQIRMVR